ncbi:hypothetical protein [Actinacidiphila soli]|uniref:hypothetical protein n=1 Tax=Actinacidiphila soli TaxID=2487275 RepID=UPI000FCB1BC2|nr:hypothetical protein [Actinacidiphila soli]
MKIRGKVAAVALVLGAAVAAAVVLWPTPAAPTHEQISEQIRASADARAQASLLEGRKAQLAILETGQTPSDELCQALWDRKTKAEQQDLWWANWLTGCSSAPSP